MRYTLISEMRDCVAQIEQGLYDLTAQLAEMPLVSARVFRLPGIQKGDELSEITSLNVQPFHGEGARRMALEHLRVLFMQQQSESLSTRSASRLPGVLCVRADPESRAQLTTQAQQINQQKALLETLITRDSGLAPEARFPFVHQHLPGLITLNAYRTLTLEAAPASVHFGWANKHVIKNVTRDEICRQLEKSLAAGRARAPWTREQWAEKVAAELELISELPVDAPLKIKRPVKVQPVARLRAEGSTRQRQLPCPMPLIFCCEGATGPVIGDLGDYDEAMITHRHIPKAIPMQLLIPRLWLWLANE